MIASGPELWSVGDSVLSSTSLEGFRGDRLSAEPDEAEGKCFKLWWLVDSMKPSEPLARDTRLSLLGTKGLRAGSNGDERRTDRFLDFDEESGV